MSDDPPKPKPSRIKLALFLPWDKNGRLFHPEKYMPKDEPPNPPSADSKIVKFPPPPKSDT